MSRSNMLNQKNLDWKSNHPYLWFILQVLGIGFLFLVGFLGALLVVLVKQSPLGQGLGGSLSWLFSTNSVQTMWYITRSAGIIAYLLLWFSMVWGLALPSKIFDRILPRAFSYDFHQFISLLAIGFTLLHVVVLLFDQYLPYNLAQILVPFLSPYRPVWVGLGVIGFYLSLLVTVTFYLRSRIGMKAFQSIHLLSLLGYLGATLHGLFAGTDSSLVTTQWMYFGTFLVLVFLTAYWLVIRRSEKALKPALSPVPIRAAKP